mmetsp:Transcript_33046/g.87350  ORF Transcript_33046/g.87350 Transcript_33046/m.87350 type:complete len:493 (-) Transcript_33046:3-1481(-)
MWALLAVVEMQAVATELVTLSAVLHPCVADVHAALSVHHRVEPFLLRVEVLVVSRDDHAALQVHHLRGHLEAAPLDLPEAAPALALERRVQVQHRGQGQAARPAVELDLVHPETGVGEVAEPAPVRVLHGRVVRLDPDGAGLAVHHHLAELLAAGVLHVLDLLPGAPGLHLERVDGGVPRFVELDPHPGDMILSVEADNQPLLVAGARPRAVAAPSRPYGAAVDGRRRWLVRPLLAGLRARDAELQLGACGDGLDAVRGGLAARRRGHADAVPGPPAHRDRVVLEEELGGARGGGGGEQRPGPLKLAAVDVDPGVLAVAAQEAIAHHRVRVLCPRSLGDVDRRRVVHRLGEGADLEEAARLHEQGVRAQDEAALAGVPLELPLDHEGVHCHVRIHVPRLAGRHDDPGALHSLTLLAPAPRGLRRDELLPLPPLRPEFHGRARAEAAGRHEERRPPDPTGADRALHGRSAQGKGGKRFPWRLRSLRKSGVPIA